MSSFRKPIIGKRFSGGTRTNGKWIKGSTTPLNIIAGVQPLKPAQMLMLPESRRRAGEVYRIYTDTQLYTTQSAENADIVTIDSEDFEVTTEEIWNNNIINHKKFLVVKLTAK